MGSRQDTAIRTRGFRILLINPLITSLTIEKIPLDQLLAQTMSDEIQPVSDNQLILFA
jgi:hypothetical protein